MRKTVDRNGFTFVEIVVVVGILAALTGLAVVNLSGIQRKSYLDAQVQTVIADMKSQQLKAMTGESEGGSNHDAYGLKLNTSNYILFRGSAYNASDTHNFTIVLDGNIQFNSVSFPDGQIVFASGSGELSGNTNSFTLTNSVDGKQKTITVNRYGAITSIN